MKINKQEANNIILTMQFAINALEQIKSSMGAMSDILDSDMYRHKAQGLQEGIDYLIRLKKVKEGQIETKNKEI